MSVRTHETTVTFRRAFMLTAFDGPQPAGRYRLVTEDEAIPDLSFAASRRTATLLHLPALATSHGPQQVVPVSAEELAAALEADGRDAPEHS